MTQPSSNFTNGEIPEDLIIIQATTPKAGIKEEYDVITMVYGIRNIDWFLIKQSLITYETDQGGPFLYMDVIEIELRTGEIEEIMFDITSFYGKSD